MSSKELRFIDLFSGIGGFRLAFEKFGCKCVYSSDIDVYACETYKKNFGEYPLSDITKVDTKSIPDFDILCGGFPCQPFSAAGKRLGFNDARGTLFFDIARILKKKKPKAFFLENVKGITNHDNGNTLHVIEEVLSDLDYEFEWRVLNARDYGVPQNRERWYCVGFRKDIIEKNNSFAWPEALKKKATLKDVIKTISDEEYSVSEICKKNILKGIKRKNINIDDYTLAYEIRPSRCQFSTDHISPCLTAKMGTGGNNVPVVVKQNRKLTEKECLNIMGFPKNYKIDKGYQSYKQIGNSVAVPVVTLIAQKIVDFLEG